MIRFSSPNRERAVGREQCRGHPWANGPTGRVVKWVSGNNATVRLKEATWPAAKRLSQLAVQFDRRGLAPAKPV
jgi:hypothetical protein